MTLDEIEKLIPQGESHVLEFKKSTARLKSACETACAFLNSDGGTVLIGVTDDGRLTGQEVGDKTKREIGNALAKISPIANVRVTYTALIGSNKYIIVLQMITDSTKKPYTYDGRAFLRNQSDTLPMPREYYQRLTLSNAGEKNAWEQQITSDATMDDLNINEIMATIKEGASNGRILKNFSVENHEVTLKRLGLLDKNKITNAALILFGKHPEQKHPQCLLRLARFKGTTKAEFIDNKRVTGNIFKLLDAAMAFAYTHLPISSTFPKEAIKRKDTPFFPVVVLREAIANALCHRDYSNYGGSVGFAIFSDRIEIWNSGLLPNGITLKNLKKVNCSLPRNRKIANILYYRKIFESWGRGVQMILDECKAAGHPEPIYSQDGIGTKLTLPYKQAFGVTQASHNSTKTTETRLSTRKQEIIGILTKHGALSTEQIRHTLKTPPSERWLRHELLTLKKTGLIDVQGQTTKRKWFIPS